MTLKELITTNPEIAKIYIELRDEKGHLITAYHIGALETEDRCLSPNNEPRWITIPKELNTRRTGKDYWGVIVSAIPKSLLDKQVTNWSSWYAHGYECNNGLESFSWLTVNLLGSDFCIETDAKEVKELPGQMNIEDYLGGNE